jgi:Ca2+-binding EF-hand superfamily protein
MFYKYGMKDVSKYEMDTVLAMVDADNSGLIAFDEFLRTCIHPSEMLTKESL